MRGQCYAARTQFRGLLSSAAAAAHFPVLSSAAAAAHFPAQLALLLADGNVVPEFWHTQSFPDLLPTDAEQQPVPLQTTMTSSRLSRLRAAALHGQLLSRMTRRTITHVHSTTGAERLPAEAMTPWHLT